MVGAILGDIIGSPYEADNIKTKDFPLFSEDSRPTDDSVMTMAVAKALFCCKAVTGGWEKLSEYAVRAMQEFGALEPYAGYGGNFSNWLWQKNPQPYNSFGNGAGMRVSPVAFVAQSLDECLSLSDAVTRVSHNHPEGMKGARAVAAATFLARQGKSKEEIKEYTEENFYPLDFTLDQIRDEYLFHVDCMNSVPQAIEAFLEGEDFEDCIRNAVSIGGDSDTIGSMCGAIAEAYYGLDESWIDKAREYCRPKMFCYVEALEIICNGYAPDFIFEGTLALAGTAKAMKLFCQTVGKGQGKPQAKPLDDAYRAGADEVLSQDEIDMLLDGKKE